MNISLVQDCLRTIDSETIQASMSPKELEELRKEYLYRVLLIEDAQREMDRAKAVA